MQFPNIVIQALNKIIDADGIMSVADGAGVNYRTLRRVSDTGECASEEVYNNIQSYVIRRTDQKRAEERELTAKLKGR